MYRPRLRSQDAQGRLRPRRRGPRPLGRVRSNSRKRRSGARLAHARRQGKRERGERVGPGGDHEQAVETEGDATARRQPEIAEICGAPVPTIKSRILKAEETLRKLIRRDLNLGASSAGGPP